MRVSAIIGLQVVMTGGEQAVENAIFAKSTGKRERARSRISLWKTVCNLWTTCGWLWENRP
ncbi:MAG: hypothetical protein IGR92_18035 [Leptolyngbyaceae cyanobacterium T60_A2020_046]|nr:hypothetical protein [Leptolyngbyaceae cyanobacterium T60_A2020_046]